MPAKSTKRPATKPKTTGLDLSGLATASDKKGASDEYPIFPDPTGLIGAEAATLRSTKASIKVLETQKEASIKAITEAIVPFYFAHSEGNTAPLTGIQIQAEVGEGEEKTVERVALAVISNKYPLIVDDKRKKIVATELEAKIVDIVGAKVVDKYFPYQAEVKLDITKVAKERQQAFLDGLKKLIATHEAKEAVEVKQGRQANGDFHAARNLILTPEQNVKLQAIYPAQVSLK